MSTYTRGKAAYDAKQYGQALGLFDECVDLEPARARWHYNRGLALKKLRRDSEAIQAFLDSRRIDASYKTAEIDSKLSELGYSSLTGSAAAPVDPRWFGAIALVLGLAAVFVVVKVITWLFRQSPATPAAPSGPDPRASKVPAALATLAARQAPLEHALAPDDDPQGRALVEKAGNELQSARFLLQGRGNVPALEATVARASAAIDAATRHFETTKGPGWSQVQGERVGCFFCARPLAAKSARSGVNLTSAQGRWAVVACQFCANKVNGGGAATVRMVGAGSRLLHWAQLDSFDPYQHGYWGGPPSQDVEPWKAELTGERLNGLATLLGAAAVGATVAAFLDLEAAREAGLAAQAAAAAANHATRSRSSGSQSWRDNS